MSKKSIKEDRSGIKISIDEKGSGIKKVTTSKGTEG
jgi:hypothetical protein